MLVPSGESEGDEPLETQGSARADGVANGAVPDGGEAAGGWSGSDYGHESGFHAHDGDDETHGYVPDGPGQWDGQDEETRAEASALDRMSASVREESWAENDPGEQEAGPEIASGGKWWERGGREPVGDADRDPYDENAINETEARSSTSVAPSDWSSRFMGPAWRRGPAAFNEPDVEDEDPETVIRETFKSALEQSEADAEERDDAEAAEPEEHRSSWREAGARGPAPEAPSRRAAYAEEDEDDSNYGQRMPVPDPESADMDYGAFDPDVNSAVLEQERLNALGAAAETAEEEAYSNDPDGYGFDEADESANIDASIAGRFAPHGKPYAQPREDDYGDDYADGGPVRSVSGEETLDDPFRDDYDDLALDDIERDEGLAPLPLGADSDTAEDDYEPAGGTGRGGLAVAAAWAVFLFMLGGAVMGVLSFRGSIMAALPGTAGLYQTLGYDISSNKVDFTGVDYRWSEIDGRPAIELSGEVVNMTDERVPVPRVVVNVRNSSGTPVTATASVPVDQLEPGASAPFALELVAPPEDVTQIELEFAAPR